MKIILTGRKTQIIKRVYYRIVCDCLASQGTEFTHENLQSMPNSHTPSCEFEVQRMIPQSGQVVYFPSRQGLCAIAPLWRVLFFFFFFFFFGLLKDSGLTIPYKKSVIVGY